MSLSRRNFMRAGAVAAAFAAFPLKSVLGQRDEGSTPPGAQSSASNTNLKQLDYYTESSFTPYVDTQFRVYLSPSNTLELKLTEVKDYLATLPRSVTKADPFQTECFSLILTIPSGIPFAQDTYLIEHDALGSFYLFTVPVGKPGQSATDYYEAVIYRRPLYSGWLEYGSGEGTNPVPTTIPPGHPPVVINNPASGQDAAPGRGAVVITPPVGVRISPGLGAVAIENPADGKKPKTEHDVYYFRPEAIKSNAVSAPPVDPGAAGRRAAAKLTVAQAPAISGLKLGMTIEQVLAPFPGIKDDAKIRSSLSKPPSEFGEQSLVIKPGKYLPKKKKFDQVSQIVFTFLDGRVSNLYVGYDGPVWNHVDEFVAKFSEETKLPGADSWDAYVGMDTQLKTLKCKDFEVSVFAGGNNVNINYVQISNTTARQTLKERRAKARKANGSKP